MEKYKKYFKTADKKDLLLSIGLVVRCEENKVKEVVEQLSKNVGIVYLKTSNGKLWEKEDLPVFSEKGRGDEFRHA